jgi:hypothetical protein
MGPAGRFYAGDPLALSPRGNAGGSPKVFGASQTGSRLATYNWDVNRANFETGHLLMGDYIAWDTPTGWRELHMIVQDPLLDDYGFSWLHISPPIRESPADGATVIVTNPTCVMMLENDEQIVWEETPGGFYSVRFSAVEVFAQ